MSQTVQISAAELEALRAKVAKLEEQKNKSQVIRAKVSEKGALSIYGLQRFPVTLYKSQWERLLAQAEFIKEFIKANPTLVDKD